MTMGSSLVTFSVDRPVLVAAASVAVAVVLAVLAILPSVWPGTFGMLHPAAVDTDPENMLDADEPVRLFHGRMKKALALYDMVVVGVVNDEHPDGVFSPATLRRVHELIEFAKGLRGEAIGAEPGEGVVESDIIAPSTVDSIEPVPGANEVRFRWLMRTPPETPEAARKVLADAQRVPFFRGTMVPPTPGDGRAVCLYLPVTRKDLSHAIYKRLQAKIATFDGPEQYHITGLPVAEDTFGVEMFIQMAISAPAAMIVIFVLMLAFFRKLIVIVSPMIVAMISVVVTMAALVISGHPVHIMSSMIPIFIMPIAVLDSIHIISEFFERYQATRDRRQTILKVMDHLFGPMLYTSLTSAAGFASLALTPIPPVQVFGVFVAAGIMAAWLLTVTFIPAFVMFISPKALANFGARRVEGGPAHAGAMGRLLQAVGGATYRRAKPILAVSAAVLVVAGWGISRIRVNDNPIKWFAASHPIRQADRVLNDHFGGTYMAYLALDYRPGPFNPAEVADDIAARAQRRAKGIDALAARVAPAGGAVQAATLEAFYDAIKAALKADADRADDEAQAVWAAGKEFLERSWDPFADPPATFDAATYAADLGRRAGAWAGQARQVLDRLAIAARGAAGEKPATREAFLDAIGRALAASAPASAPAEAAAQAARTVLGEWRQADEVFKRPDVLAFVKGLQDALASQTGGRVGKSNSIVQIVETVNRDLHGGQSAYEAVPASRAGVAQCLSQFESSHRPKDLYHFVTADYRTGSIWTQLTSGDNKDMAQVVAAADAYVAAHAPPVPLEHRWFGLTYINVVWQQKMVGGMLQAFAGSFLVVFLLMTILFRSSLWGLLCMIPLTVTIAAIYGVVGLVGKDYDMPVAVLSSLTLGLAVDFAIHFLARGRQMQAERGSWEAAAPAVFGEPARAIARNIIVIAAGFLPLLLAPLVPYKTVGALLATILIASGIGTLLILPALMRLGQRRLFVAAKPMGRACNCAVCLVATATTVALIALTLHQFEAVGWGALTWGGAAAVVILGGLCGILSRRQQCRQIEASAKEAKP